ILPNSPFSVMIFQILLFAILIGIVIILSLLLRPVNMETYNLAVIGVVLDNDSQPIDHAQVFLEDLSNGGQLKAFTRQNGGFWFRLRPNINYRLLLLDANQEIIDETNLTTLNVESNIFDVTLRSSQSTKLSYVLAH
ncbi:MAG: carboxypeptidase-like regulatory domain-containing protein, partial [Chitinophagales bacterium]